jgi:3-phytase
MTSNRIWLLPIFIILLGCNNQQSPPQEKEILHIPALYEVTADMETDPVQTQDDAADDPCIWYNSNDPAESRIIGTNKKSGLSVYDLKGKELYHFSVGNVNNVDIRYGFILGDEKIDIVGATNRSFNSISLFRVWKTGALESLSIDKIISNTNEVYGFCFYQSRRTGKLYANLVAKSGVFEQYELDGKSGTIQATLVRTFDVGSQCEGMVADDELQTLFIGEEGYGVWKYQAEPDGGEERVSITDLTNDHLEADIEGLTLYFADNQKGYLIVSSQGNNRFAVFQRSGNHSYLGSFTIVESSKMDGVSDTDGIDVINRSLGEAFPYGFFIVQDGSNINDSVSANQNFKVVSWGKIATTFYPNLIVDTEFDYRWGE